MLKWVQLFEITILVNLIVMYSERKTEKEEQTPPTPVGREVYIVGAAITGPRGAEYSDLMI